VRKILIDCGANDNHQDYTQKFGIGEEKYDDFEIHAFEPNPTFKRSFSDTKVVFYQKAIWIKDERKDFYLEPDKVGCTLMKEKMEADPGMTDKAIAQSINTPIQVDCIDIAKFIENNFDKDDLIYLRMDIEGAEFGVLNHLINTGIASYIDEFWIEFHRPEIVEDSLLQKISLFFNNDGIGKLKIDPSSRWKPEITTTN
jgi:FkbM family methyltransferase